ncbi:MAG: group II intron reverse transcriptase/maturase [Planctomycetes bacterium]|nr:group II intron reverse transcriptase/maturase [Planctomycetota bacterium]
MEMVVDPDNMRAAWKQVKRNKGAAGVDGRNIEDTMAFLRDNWPTIRLSLLDESYRPYPALRVEIPKPGGGVRKLGIPTVLDRVIQQAICQVLTPIFDPGFSPCSYGYRPGRRPQDAIRQAQAFQNEGKHWVVDMDLKQFFDEVDHDILMSRLGRKIKDKRLKRLINAFLKAGVQRDNCTLPTDKGTPQGGPLSPLLSNILLDDFDKELERRGLRFCRYADDCNIYVGSRRAAERVLASATRFIEGTLKLIVNRKKSAVGRPVDRVFLGFSFYRGRRGVQIHVPESTLKKFRHHLKDLFRIGRGRNPERFIREDLNPVLRGWFQYYRIGTSYRMLKTVDFWLRRRMRCLIWRQWKRPWTRVKKLMSRGFAFSVARAGYNRRGPWWNAGTRLLIHALPPFYFQQLGLFDFESKLRQMRTTLT